MQDILYSSAHEIAAAIRQREVSASEVVAAHLAHIRTRNPALNALVTLEEEAASRRARLADEALTRGEVWGPLHGVPLTLKDCLAVAGMRTTAGFPPLADYVPSEDATVTARLRAAGAIILGKTNVPVLASDAQTTNPLFGRTNNPWNISRTPGGSSGGAAAAVAAGLVPLEIGSDLGGSIRIPSHFCGVFGLKPTEHRVSIAGHIPDLPGVLAVCASWAWLDRMRGTLRICHWRSESSPVPTVAILKFHRCQCQSGLRPRCGIYGLHGRRRFRAFPWRRISGAASSDWRQLKPPRRGGGGEAAAD